MVLIVLLDSVALQVFGWDDADIATEYVEGLLDDVFVHFFWIFVVLQPWVRLEAHQSAYLVTIFVHALDKNHDVAVGFLDFLKTLLLDHLRMVHEADELPVAQMNYSLRHTVRQVNDRNLLVSWSECFVRHQRVVNHPRLSNWLLIVVQIARVHSIVLTFKQSGTIR